MLSYTLSISVDLLFPENPNLLIPDTSSIILHRLNRFWSRLHSDFELDLYNRKETLDLVEAFLRLPTQDLRRGVCAMVRTIAKELSATSPR